MNYVSQSRREFDLCKVSKVDYEVPSESDDVAATEDDNLGTLYTVLETTPTKKAENEMECKTETPPVVTGGRTVASPALNRGESFKLF